MLEYMIYPNGDYYSCEDYDEHPTWASDDFYILEIPEDVEEVEEYIIEHLMAVDLGDSCEIKTKGPLA